MKLSEAQRAHVRRLLGSNSTSFVDLARAAKLDPGTAFREADLRRINFGADDLAGFDFTGADLRGANLSHARGLDPALLEGARTDDATRGFIIRDFPGGPDMVLIPPGNFLMGVPKNESAREKSDDRAAFPRERIEIQRPFLLSQFPVTREQFGAFASHGGYALAGSGWRDAGFPQDDNHPVVNVTYSDACEYASWAGNRSQKPYRLPSEAEWEYAARAQTTFARYWGEGTEDICRYANVADQKLRNSRGDQPNPDRYAACNDGYINTSPVGKFLPNSFGLYDMLGNVWEWCEDNWHRDYIGRPIDGSAWNTGGDTHLRVIRGGAWYVRPMNIRSGYRTPLEATGKADDIGFRVARFL